MTTTAISSGGVQQRIARAEDNYGDWGSIPPSDFSTLLAQAGSFVPVTPQKTAAANTSGQLAANDIAAGSQQADSLYERMMQQLLANRLGVNKHKLDEVKRKIEELEQIKQDLQSKPMADEAVRQKQLARIDQQLADLEKQAERLVAEAIERMKQRQEQPQSTKLAE